MKSLSKILVLALLVGVLMSFNMVAHAAKSTGPTIQAYGVEVIDYTRQKQRRWALSTTWDNMGWEDTYYKDLTFRNGYEFDRIETSYTSTTFDGFYYYRYKIVKYYYTTW